MWGVFGTPVVRRFNGFWRASTAQPALWQSSEHKRKDRLQQLISHAVRKVTSTLMSIPESSDISREEHEEMEASIYQQMMLEETDETQRLMFEERGESFAAVSNYVEMGYHVLPCKERGKSPAVSRGVNDATDKLGTFEDLSKMLVLPNVAIAGGHDLIIIDLDVKAVVNGLEDLRQIAEDAGEKIPEDCPMAKTPSGGYHLYFHCENSVQYTNGVGITYKGEKTGIDVRADGCYVLAAPSAVKDPEKEGSVIHYEWIRPLVPMDELPELPEWLKKVLPKKTNNNPPTGKPPQDFRDKCNTPIPNTGISASDRENRIRKYICTMDESIQGEKGSDTTFGVLGRLWHGFGLSEDELRRWAGYYNETKCKPQWSVTELNHKIEDVVNTWQPQNGKPRGHLLTEQKDKAYQFGGESFTQEDENRFIKPLLENEEKKRKATSTQQGTPAMSEFEDTQLLGIPTDELHKEEDFPLDAFPNEMKAFIKCTADSFNQPYEVVGFPLLGMVAGIIGNKRVARTRNGWIIPSSIWVLLHGAPSSGKTPILKSVVDLIDDCESEKIRKFNSELVLYARQKEEYDRELKDFRKREKKKQAEALKKSLAEAEEATVEDGQADQEGGGEDERNAVPSDGQTGRNKDGKKGGILFDVADVEPELPPKPFDESFMIESATIEGVRKKMSSNGGFVLLFDDEFEGFTGGFDQYTNAKGVANSFWNKTYNQATVRLTLASSGTEVIPNAAASLLGGVQTEVFEGKDFLKNQKYLMNGFLARFVIVGIDYKRVDRRAPSLSEDVSKEIRKTLQYLLDMRWSGDTHGEKPSSRNFEPVITDLDSEADTLLCADQDFYDDWIADCRDNHFAAMLGKIKGRTGRFALALWCLKGEPRGGGGAWGLIDKATMEAAIRINFRDAVEWFITYYGLRGKVEETKVMAEAEKELIQMIRDKGGVPKGDFRKAGVPSATRRMMERLVLRKALIECSRKNPSGQMAKYILAPDAEG